MASILRQHGASQLLITHIQDPSAIETYLDPLRQLLLSCVNTEPSMSSIGFLSPLSNDTATEYWLQVFTSATGPEATTTLLVVTDPSLNDPNAVIATVQLARNIKETHDHKGEIRKLLVHPSSRNSGIGRRLMDAVEDIARKNGVAMLLLDTATETPARNFYLRLGWKEWGLCPGYAKFANGRKADCTFFLKML